AREGLKTRWVGWGGALRGWPSASASLGSAKAAAVAASAARLVLMARPAKNDGTNRPSLTPIRSQCNATGRAKKHAPQSRNVPDGARQRRFALPLAYPSLAENTALRFTRHQGRSSD